LVRTADRLVGRSPFHRVLRGRGMKPHSPTREGSPQGPASAWALVFGRGVGELPCCSMRRPSSSRPQQLQAGPRASERPPPWCLHQPARPMVSRSRFSGTPTSCFGEAELPCRSDCECSVQLLDLLLSSLEELEAARRRARPRAARAVSQAPPFSASGGLVPARAPAPDSVSRSPKETGGRRRGAPASRSCARQAPRNFLRLSLSPSAPSDCSRCFPPRPTTSERAEEVPARWRRSFPLRLSLRARPCNLVTPAAFFDDRAAVLGLWPLTIQADAALAR